MLDFLDIADLLGWHDVDVAESVETSEFPTIYPVMDIAMDSIRRVAALPRRADTEFP